jgi:hypothetical protein
MSYLPSKVFTGTIASGASTATSIDISGQSYSKVFAQLSTMSTGAAVSVYGSADNSDFRPVYERVNTATVQWQAVVIATATTAGLIELNGVAGIPYVQFRASATVVDGCTIKLICVD